MQRADRALDRDVAGAEALGGEVAVERDRGEGDGAGEQGEPAAGARAAGQQQPGAERLGAPDHERRVGLGAVEEAGDGVDDAGGERDAEAERVEGEQAGEDEDDGGAGSGHGREARRPRARPASARRTNRLSPQADFRAPGRVTVRQMPRLRTTRNDAIAAAVMAVLSVVQVLVAPIAPRPLGVLIALLVTVPIAFRRYQPFAATLVGISPWWLETDGFILLGYVAAFLLFYALGSHEPDGRKVLAACAFALIAGAIGVTRSAPMVYEYVGSFAIVVGPTLLGRHIRGQREQAERERDRSAQIAVAEERARIARELHDVVAHGVSVIAIQADAAEAALDRAPTSPRRRCTRSAAPPPRRWPTCAGCSASCARTRTATRSRRSPGSPSSTRSSSACAARASTSPSPRPASRASCPPASTSPPTGSSRRR